MQRVLYVGHEGNHVIAGDRVLEVNDGRHMFNCSGDKLNLIELNNFLYDSITESIQDLLDKGHIEGEINYDAVQASVDYFIGRIGGRVGEVSVAISGPTTLFYQFIPE